jgi:biotin transporter BioY
MCHNLEHVSLYIHGYFMASWALSWILLNSFIVWTLLDSFIGQTLLNSFIGWTLLNSLLRNNSRTSPQMGCISLVRQEQLKGIHLAYHMNNAAYNKQS